jgi:hypothetical protein
MSSRPCLEGSTFNGLVGIRFGLEANPGLQTAIGRTNPVSCPYAAVPVWQWVALQATVGEVKTEALK